MASCKRFAGVSCSAADPRCAHHVQNWLYEDGEDEKKSVYVAKLEELRKEGDAIERRAAEATSRGPAAASLTALAGSYATAATSDDAKLAHISPENKQKARPLLYSSEPAPASSVFVIGVSTDSQHQHL